MVVNRNYNLPGFADEETLVIVSSYSGGTEESLSVLNEALGKGCKIVCLSTGGEVMNISKKNKLAFVPLKPGMQPRYALGQSFFSLLGVLESCGLVHEQTKTCSEIADLWKIKGDQYSQDGNTALNFAQQLTGFIPVIYSAADFNDAVGYRFKCQLNENSKLHAFHNVLPESNHNEIVGWESFIPKNFQAKVINLVDHEYPEQIKKRFRITSKLISEGDIEIISLEGSGENLKIRLFDLIYLTDWITYYLAVLRGYDPVEINNINSLKSQLG